jgi:metallophosphoesterase superfamily enzyme
MSGQKFPFFFDKLSKKCNIILIPGNHDSNIQKLAPKEVSLISSMGMVEDNILLTHGHTMPSINFSHVDMIIMGHIHPVFFQEDSIVNGQRVWISLKTKKQEIFHNSKGDLEIIIVPSFNKYFYAMNKKKYRKSISPIIERLKDISDVKIITLDGTIIGNESIIDQIL